MLDFDQKIWKLMANNLNMEGLLWRFNTVEMLRLAHALVIVHHAGVVVHVTVPEISDNLLNLNDVMWHFTWNLKHS